MMALVQALAREQGKTLRIAMAAPTGKAAMRLSESMNQARKLLPQNMQLALPAQAAPCTGYSAAFLTVSIFAITRITRWRWIC